MPRMSTYCWCPPVELSSVDDCPCGTPLSVDRRRPRRSADKRRRPGRAPRRAEKPWSRVRLSRSADRADRLGPGVVCLRTAEGPLRNCSGAGDRTADECLHSGREPAVPCPSDGHPADATRSSSSSNIPTEAAAAANLFMRAVILLWRRDVRNSFKVVRQRSPLSALAEDDEYRVNWRSCGTRACRRGTNVPPSAERRSSYSVTAIRSTGPEHRATGHRRVPRRVRGQVVTGTKTDETARRVRFSRCGFAERMKIFNRMFLSSAAARRRQGFDTRTADDEGVERACRSTATD